MPPYKQKKNNLSTEGSLKPEPEDSCSMQSSSGMLARVFLYTIGESFLRAARFRSESGETVFAYGLFLDEVYYKEACLGV